MIEKETGILEDPRFKFTTEPRHFTFMGRPHVAHYPKCATKIYKICRTLMFYLVSKMVKNGIAREKEQNCRFFEHFLFMNKPLSLANERSKLHTLGI